MDLVLLPGLDGTGDLFEPLTAAIGKDARPAVIRYDRSRPQTLDEHCDDVLAAVAEWESKIVIAESFSSLVLGRLIERGVKPRAAIVCAGFTGPPRPVILSLARRLPLERIFRMPPPSAALRIACLGWDVSAELVQSAARAIASVKPAVLAMSPPYSPIEAEK